MKVDFLTLLLSISLSSSHNGVARVMIVQDGLGSARTRRNHERERERDDGSSVVPKCCYFSNDFTSVSRRASSGGKVLTVYCNNVQGTNKDTSSLGGETVFRSPVVQVVWEGRKKKGRSAHLMRGR